MGCGESRERSGRDLPLRLRRSCEGWADVRAPAVLGATAAEEEAGEALHPWRLHRHRPRQEESPKLLARRKFCSLRCTFLDRLHRGWCPPQFTLAQRRLGGRVGAKASARTRHRNGLHMRAEHVTQKLPASALQRFDQSEWPFLKALVARGVRIGYRWGYHAALVKERRRSDRGRPRQKKAA